MAIANSNPQHEEIIIRKRIASIYSKREEDFPSLREYNDYLEEVEDMIWDLIQGKDVHAIEAKIAVYQEENAEQISINRARKDKDDDADAAVNQGKGQYAPTTGQQRRPGYNMQPLPLGGVHDALKYAVVDEVMRQLRAETDPGVGNWSPRISRKRSLFFLGYMEAKRPRKENPTQNISGLGHPKLITSDEIRDARRRKRSLEEAFGSICVS